LISAEGDVLWQREVVFIRRSGGRGERHDKRVCVLGEAVLGRGMLDS